MKTPGHRLIQSHFPLVVGALLMLAAGGAIVLPFLRPLYPPPEPWLRPAQNRHPLEWLLGMDVAPGVAALATACSLGAIALRFVARWCERVSARHDSVTDSPLPIRLAWMLSIIFALGLLNLWGMFLTGLLQLGWINWLWVLGFPCLMAASFERSPKSVPSVALALFFPGWIAFYAWCLLLNIDPI